MGSLALVFPFFLEMDELINNLAATQQRLIYTLSGIPSSSSTSCMAWHGIPHDPQGFTYFGLMACQKSSPIRPSGKHWALRLLLTVCWRTIACAQCWTRSNRTLGSGLTFYYKMAFSKLRFICFARLSRCLFAAQMRRHHPSTWLHPASNRVVVYATIVD